MTTNTTVPDLNDRLRGQLDFAWRGHVRPRLEGLTDEEYHWEPVPGMWGVRARGTGTAPIQAGVGAMTIDFEIPEPDPAPVTTIAWRLAHVVVGVLGVRNAAHFGREPVGYESFDYAATADEALTQLDAEYATWLDGVTALGEDGLARPVGPSEGDHAEDPYLELVLHIHREVIHHLAEVCLLRDLYRATGGARLEEGRR
jgi:hypothetical protein